ncbi:MAG: type I-B CRISPR-associated protein Cas7/Csh2 [Methanogenium sp.]|jgi:CRISPR-associated protein Csh2
MTAKSRELLMIWDSTMANPNGDMTNENRPRADTQTGQLEVSDVRIKRFIRDEWISSGLDVFVQTLMNEKGTPMTGKQRLESVVEQMPADQNAQPYILGRFIDARLFGIVAAVKKVSFNITGPLQIMWSKSINTADSQVKFVQGNAAYASNDTAGQTTIWSKYIAPYALFKTYCVFNSQAAVKQNINISETDIDNFIKAFINGLINYRSTSKNQMPRLLIEVIYKEHKLSGELDVADIKYDCDDDQLRAISQTHIDLSKLCQFVAEQPAVDKVRLYVHKSVKLENVSPQFEIFSI